MCTLFFFVQRKTSYGMRISDWSPDVCSSDLGVGDRGRCARSGHARRCAARRRGIGRRGGKGGVALAGRGLLSRTRAQGWATRWRQRRRRKPSWRRRGTGLKPPSAAPIRGWVVQRRERTRHLIELGGLVQKAGLVELTDDDRATLYGAMLDLAARAQGDGNALALWKRRGKRAFDAEAEGQDNAEGNAHD